MDKLVVYPDGDARQSRPARRPRHNSQRVLLALTQAGMSREDAYRAVQRNAMPVWEGSGKFLDLLKADPEVTKF